MDGRFPAAVLVATMPSSGPPRRLFWRTLRRHPLRLIQAVATRDMRPLVVTAGLCREQFFSEELSDPDLTRYSRAMQGESMDLQFDLLRNKPGVPTHAIPMLVLGAEHDDFAPSTQRATAERYGADCVIVSGSGHDVMLDVQWRAAADVILDWLQHTADLTPPLL
jgi:pimeloyl-ACP methyl ester carboxylesterase